MSPFDNEPDPELGRMLREALTGPEPEAFLRRLRVAAAAAERGDQWDVLAGWARPRAMAVAVAAAFLLWLGTWFARLERTDRCRRDHGLATGAHRGVVPAAGGRRDHGRAAGKAMTRSRTGAAVLLVADLRARRSGRRRRHQHGRPQARTRPAAITPAQLPGPARSRIST